MTGQESQGAEAQRRRDAAHGSPHGVVVLGMHRSGTSVASLLLSHLGLAGPRPADQIPADEDNPKGYFESRSMSSLGDDLLADLESAWDAPPPAAEVADRLPELAGRRGRAKAVADAALGPQPWLWKDPRACILLPFWDEVLGRDDPLLLVHRSSWDVADSLQRRNGLALDYGLALWERYTLGALISARGRAVLVTSYEALLENAESWLESVRDFLLGQGLPVTAPRPDLRSELLRPRVRASVATAQIVERQQPLEDLLRQLRGPHAALDLPDLPGESQLTSTLLSLRRDVVKTEFWARAQTQQRRYAEDQARDLAQELEQTRRQHRVEREFEYRTHVQELEDLRVEARARAEHLERELDTCVRANRALQLRSEQLLAIEQGGWWQLRRLLLPVLRPAGAVRRRLRRGPAPGGP
jgi:hypothetical protein